MLTQELLDKINSVQTSPKMKALIGYALDFALTTPVITEVIILNGTVICATSNRPSYTYILCNYESLKENWNSFWEILQPELTDDEQLYVHKLFTNKFSEVK